MSKTVLVTGASRGIGRETAIYLAKNGFDIVLHYNKSQEKILEVQKLIEETGQKTRILQFDVSNREQTEKVLLQDIENNGIYYGVVVNTLGACGAIEAIMSIEMLNNNWFCPILNLKNVDERCGELDYIMHKPYQFETEYIMSNNFAFGGINTSLIFKRI